ncbi:hypothetical protein [Hyphomicrobium facile]|uniref:Uncharacterized protein n=1 Tax=Hyphomicrobium facile TaxID=51670 RepID=A0A1I7N068_9HYPH|nr:hypothetical protein [Hyphomicrobium facile]SFV28018.1 hypothetical protein SAMN04488557_0906 [Hyphomicrobium facile]
MTTCACANCQFYDTHMGGAAKHKEKDTGLCRFNPPLPQTASANTRAAWPVVEKSDWCGHFAATVERMTSVAA